MIRVVWPAKEMYCSISLGNESVLMKIKVTHAMNRNVLLLHSNLMISIMEIQVGK